MKAFSKAITWLLVVVVLLGVFGLLYSFVGNGQRNFYVRYGNTPIPARADNYEFEKNAYTVIECGFPSCMDHPPVGGGSVTNAISPIGS